MSCTIVNGEQIREAQGLYLSVATYATVNLADCIDGVEGCPQQALVRVFGELCFAALLVASLVECVVRLALTLISIPVCILTCDCDYFLSSWLAEGAFISLGNAFCIATDVLIQNICLQKLDLYSAEVSANTQHDVAGYTLNLSAMKNPNTIVIPKADAIDVTANFDVWSQVLDQEYKLLSDIDDFGGYGMSWSEVKRRWDQKLPGYVAGFSPREIRYMNAMRHLTLYIQRGWEQHVAPLSSNDKELIKLHFTRPPKDRYAKETPKPLLAVTALSPAQREAVCVLRNAAEIIRTLGQSYFHCTNKQGPAAEGLYRKFVAMDTSALERETLGFALRLVLVELRDQIFNEALARILESGGDQAATDNYYRRTLGKKYGVPADISQHDTNFVSWARKGQEGVFERLFAEKYTISNITAFLQQRLSAKDETVFTSTRFSGEWIARGYRQQGGDLNAVMVGDKYSPDVIFAFLKHEKIIVRR